MGYVLAYKHNMQLIAGHIGFLGAKINFHSNAVLLGMQPEKNTVIRKVPWCSHLQQETVASGQAAWFIAMVHFGGISGALLKCYL